MISLPDLLKKVLGIYTNNLRTIFLLLIVLLLWNIILSVAPVNAETTFRLAIPVAIASIVISAFTELALIGGFSALIQNTPAAPISIITRALKLLPVFVIILVLWFLVISLGLLFLIIPGIIFATWFMFIGPLLMLEGGNPLHIFRKSKQLVSGHFFELLLRVATIMLATIIIVGAASQGFNYIAEQVSPASALPYLKTVGAIFSSIISALFLPIISGAMVTLYYEMKKLKS